MTAVDRTADLNRFYRLLQRLAAKTGGGVRLADATGRQSWPERGVYFFFEDGEGREPGPPRVVRVGTHALASGSRSTLWGRLSQHRGKAGDRTGNHRGSIFRDLVGQAIMARDRQMVPSWGNGNSADRGVRDAEAHLERLVSAHIGAMKVLCLEVDDDPSPASLRGMIERNAIALLSNYSRPAIDPPSSCWLGNLSGREKVRRSGLWNNRHVDESYDPSFLDTLERLIEGGETEASATRACDIYVIQCAKSKVSGGYLQDASGKPVLFVADPGSVPERSDVVYAHPDDRRPDGLSWRQYLLHYNAERPDNPDGLHQAIDLYRNPAYASMRDAFGAENLLLLSAGWGLVWGDFLLPQYEITFGQAGRATGYNSRALHPDFDDLVQLPDTASGRLCMIGGKDYLPLFLQLTRGYAGPKAIYYNSDVPPRVPGCELIRYPSDTRTNWHYALAKELAEGRDLSGRLEQAVPESGPAERKVRKANTPSASAGTPAGVVSRKYAALHRHLMEQGEGAKSVTLTFVQIADILGQALPASARVHAPAWWANGGHPQAEAWLRAGYRKAAHHLGRDAKSSWVRFERTS